MDKKKKQVTVTAKDLNLIRWAGVLVVVLAFAYFAIYPAVTQHQNLVDENEQLQAEVEKCSEASIATLQAQAETNYTTIDTLLAGYPLKMDSSQVDKLVTQIAEDNDVTVYSLVLGDKVKGTGYTDSDEYAIAPLYDVTSDAATKANREKTELTGIYEYTATVILCGDEENLQAVVDSLGGKSDYPYINLESFSWETANIRTSVVNATDFVTVVIDIYAYET